MAIARRETWKCATCRTGELRSATGATSGVALESSSAADDSQQEQLSLASVASQLALINVALQQLLPLKTSVETLLPLPAKVDQLLALKPAVDELRNTVGTIQSTVDSFGAKYNSVLALASTNEESVKGLQNEVCEVRATLEEQAQEILRLKEELNSSQQYSRRCNMEVHGLPYVSGENLVETMEDLSRRLNLPFRSSDIIAIHRLPRKRDSTSPVLVNFAAVGIKNAWMTARVQPQGLSRPGDQQKVF